MPARDEEIQFDSTSPSGDDVSHVEWNSGASCLPGTMEVRTFVGFGSPATAGETDLGGFDLVVQDQGFTFVIP